MVTLPRALGTLSVWPLLTELGCQTAWVSAWQTLSRRLPLIESVRLSLRVYHVEFQSLHLCDCRSERLRNPDLSVHHKFFKRTVNFSFKLLTRTIFATSASTLKGFVLIWSSAKRADAAHTFLSDFVEVETWIQSEPQKYPESCNMYCLGSLIPHASC